jgi:hypothetical protein
VFRSGDPFAVFIAELLPSPYLLALAHSGALPATIQVVPQAGVDVHPLAGERGTGCNSVIPVADARGRRVDGDPWAERLTEHSVATRLFVALTASLLLTGVAAEVTPAVAVADPGTTATATTATTPTADTLTAALTLSASQAPTGGLVTATITSSSPDSPITGYTVDFGDGTPAVRTTDTTLQHTYTSTGDYHADVTATDAAGDTSTPATPADIRVVAPAPLVPHITATAVGLRDVHVDTSATTDSWNITTVTCDFHDAEGAGQLCDSHTSAGTNTVTATFRDAGGNTATATTQYSARGSYFLGYGPTRLVDTRRGTGVAQRRVPANGMLRLTVPADIPASVTALALNLTTTNSAGAGYVVAYADGTARPPVSTVNFVAGRTVAAMSLVQPGADRSIDVFVHGNATDLVIDVTGFLARDFFDDSGSFTPFRARMLDTRNGTGTGTSPSGSNGAARPVPPGGTIEVNVAYTTDHGIEGAGLVGAMADVVATDPTAAGYLTVYPDDADRPITSNVNFVRGQTVANSVVMSTGEGYKVYNGSSGTVDVVADLEGWFGFFCLDAYAPVTPYRAFDTRQGSPLPRRTSVSQSVPAENGLTFPVDDLVMNVTVTDTRAAGDLAVTGSSDPSTTSAVNWSAGQTISNLAATQSGPTPSVVWLHNGSDGTTDVLGDVVGYFGS